MTIPSTSRKAGPLLGTGAQTAWPFTFKVFAASDIAVTIADSLGIETPLVLDTDYSVTLNANQETSPGGTVTYPISGSPLAVGSKLSIIGDLDYDQPLDLPSGGNFSPIALENELDRLTMQIQQLKEQVSRSLQVSVTTNADAALPAPAPNELIGWDSTGDNLANYALSELATGIAYGTMRFDTFVGDGTTTQFALTEDPAALANLDVSLAGVTQVPGTDYTLTSATLVFTTAPVNGVAILARYGRALPIVGPTDSSAVTYTPAGTGAVATTAQAKLRESVSVKDFGAKGDGTTDDTAAINLALATGLDVYCPRPSAGYKTSGPLLMTNNQMLFGDSQNTQILCTGVTTNAIVLTAKTRAVVKNLFIKYSGTSSGGADGAAVYIGSGASFCTVQGCRLEGVRAGVTITNANDNVIRNNDCTLTTLTYPENTWDIGVYLGGARNLITENRCFGGGYAGVQVVSSASISCPKNTISLNQVSTHTGYGIVVYSTAPGTTENNVITGNQVFDITGLFETAGSRSKGAGIYAASADYTIISNNVVENTNINTDVEVLAPGAIGVLDSSCVTVTGNIIKSPKLYGIYVTGNGSAVGSVLVENNNISSPVSTGIYVKERSHVSIIGNSVKNSTANSGIQYTHSTLGAGISVQNNKVITTASRGISIGNAREPNISGNYVEATSNGIYITTCTGGVVIGNEARFNTSNDYVIDSACSGNIFFDKNVAISTAANGINDTFGVIWGQNEATGQTNPFAGVGQLRRLDGTATPNVKGSRLADNNGGANVTDLLNPIDGQFLTIYCNNALTLKHNTGAATTKLRLNGSVDFVMAAQNTVTLFYIPGGGPWVEVGRKV